MSAGGDVLIQRRRYSSEIAAESLTAGVTLLKFLSLVQLLYTFFAK